MAMKVTHRVAILSEYLAGTKLIAWRTGGVKPGLWLSSMFWWFRRVAVTHHRI